MRIKYLYNLLLLILPLSVGASTPIDLDRISNDYLITGRDFDFFEDTSRVFQFEDILQQNNILFSSEHKSTETVTHTKSNYWVRFNLIGSEQTEKKIIEVITAQTEHISIYIPKKDGSYSESHAGYLLPFDQRTYKHKNFIFDFQNNTDFSKPLFIKIHSSNKVNLLFKIRSQHYFTQYSLTEYISLGLYYGILGMLIIYNLIIFLYLKKPVYLIYSFYVCASIGLSLSDDGLGFAYIWPNHPSWSQTLGLDIFPIAFLLGYTAYAIAFLDNRYRQIQKIIKYTTSSYLLYFIALLFFGSDKFYYSFIYSIPFITIYLSYAYIAYKNEFKLARFYIIGNSFALLGIIIEQLRLLDVLPANTVTVYAFELGIVLEFISLSLSLGYSYAKETKLRLKGQEKQISLLEEKETAQREKVEALQEKELLTQKVNRELEDKVKERTIEITEMNTNLQKLVVDLESMSITLDKENWQLKQGIKKEKQDRLSGETITIEEVKSLYPTKQLCLIFLEELKWKTEYTCTKCGHQKHSTNKDTRSKKCSKCGKIESVTSGSLYHAQKIGLQELFLLTHLAFRKNNIDVANLSQTLGVSETSIYKFIKKVKDKKEKNPKANSWEELIF